MSKELSIFIDESGDFGLYQSHSPYYIISLVFHDQNNDISDKIEYLNKHLSHYQINNNCIHTGPIVRREEIYQNMDLKERRNILNSFTIFIKKCPITFKTFYIEKKHINDEMEAITKLTKQISNFLKEYLLYFNGFHEIKVYYDNGQVEVSKMLSSIFNTLFSNVIFKKVIPSQYKLFQAADYFCYFKLLSLKLKNNSISDNEIKFFGKKYNINKNYIKEIKKREFK